MCIGLSQTSQGQQTPENLTNNFDDVSYRWDRMAKSLENYSGLTMFCTNNGYRSEAIDLLNSIHHYDSLIYARLVEISYYDNNHELQKTLQQIYKFEKEYSAQNFIKHLNRECIDRKSIEREKKYSIYDNGHNSYSGQILNIENANYHYVHHVTNLVDHIRSHIHHLNVDKMEF